MKLSAEQYADAKARGFSALKRSSLDGFAEACYDQNSYDDLKDCKTARPDTADMREWDLSAQEWRDAQAEAIEAAMEDYEYENDLR